MCDNIYCIYDTGNHTYRTFEYHTNNRYLIISLQERRATSYRHHLEHNHRRFLVYSSDISIRYITNGAAAFSLCVLRGVREPHLSICSSSATYLEKREQCPIARASACIAYEQRVIILSRIVISQSVLTRLEAALNLLS